LLDLVDLGVNACEELLPRHERLDVECPEEVPRRAAGHPLCESASAQHPESAPINSAGPKPFCGA
jgi:hypothetical protein